VYLDLAGRVVTRPRQPWEPRLGTAQADIAQADIGQVNTGQAEPRQTRLDPAPVGMCQAEAQEIRLDPVLVGMCRVLRYNPCRDKYLNETRLQPPDRMLQEEKPLAVVTGPRGMTYPGRLPETTGVGEAQVRAAPVATAGVTARGSDTRAEQHRQDASNHIGDLREFLNFTT